MVTFILLWLIAVIILFLDYKSRAQRWFSAALFLAGCNEIHFIILARASSRLSSYPLLLNLELLTYGLSTFLYPYTFLLGAIYYYSEIDITWQKRRKPFVLFMLVPVVLVYGLLL